MMRIGIDDRILEDGALDWWRSLSPGTRAVFMQAVWEIEQCPPPRGKEERAAVAKATGENKD